MVDHPSSSLEGSFPATMTATDASTIEPRSSITTPSSVNYPLLPTPHNLLEPTLPPEWNQSGSWTSKDDEALYEYRTRGFDWDQIQGQRFPDKSAHACRERHEALMTKRRSIEWDDPRLGVLAVQYRAMRAQMWSVLAKELGDTWEHVERACMQQGLEALHNLARNQDRALNHNRPHGKRRLGSHSAPSEHGHDHDRAHEKRHLMSYAADSGYGSLFSFGDFDDDSDVSIGKNVGDRPASLNATSSPGTVPRRSLQGDDGCERNSTAESKNHVLMKKAGAVTKPHETTGRNRRGLMTEAFRANDINKPAKSSKTPDDSSQGTIMLVRHMLGQENPSILVNKDYDNDSSTAQHEASRSAPTLFETPNSNGFTKKAQAKCRSPPANRTSIMYDTGSATVKSELCSPGEQQQLLLLLAALRSGFLVRALRMQPVSEDRRRNRANPSENTMVEQPVPFMHDHWSAASTEDAPCTKHNRGGTAPPPSEHPSPGCASDGELCSVASLSSSSDFGPDSQETRSILLEVQQILVQEIVRDYKRAIRRVSCKAASEAAVEDNSGSAAEIHTLPSNSGEPVQSAKCRGKRPRENDDEEDDGDDQGRNKRPNALSSPKLEAVPDKLFACPYSKWEPARYSECNTTERNYRGCSSTFLRDIPRVKQHLYRVHKRPSHCCGSCFQGFETQDSLDDHLRQRPVCEVSECPFPEKMSMDQVSKIKRRSPGLDPCQIWYNIFGTLFPNAATPKSPFCEILSMASVHSYYERYRVRAPPILRALVNSRIQGVIPLAEQWQQVLDNALEDALAELLQDIGPPFEEHEGAVSARILSERDNRLRTHMELEESFPAVGGSSEIVATDSMISLETSHGLVQQCYENTTSQYDQNGVAASRTTHQAATQPIISSAWTTNSGNTIFTNDQSSASSLAVPEASTMFTYDEFFELPQADLQDIESLGATLHPYLFDDFNSYDGLQINPYLVVQSPA